LAIDPDFCNDDNGRPQFQRFAALIAAWNVTPQLSNVANQDIINILTHISQVGEDVSRYRIDIAQLNSGEVLPSYHGITFDGQAVDENIPSTGQCDFSIQADLMRRNICIIP